MENAEFGLNDVLKNLADILSFKAEEAGVEVMFRVMPDIPRQLTGDALRLGQILINLCTNAIKFTEAGGEVILSIHIDQLNDERVKLKFSVKDTGIGISQEQQDRLFHSFSQADATISRKFGGTGLGLAISKKLVHMMEGDIWLESRLDEGSTFYFTGNFGVTSDRKIVDVSGNKQFHPDNLKVLVVDDQKSARQILLEFLENFGFEAVEAESGRQAIEILELASDQNKPFNLVLTDLRMPGMDGIEVTKAIKSDTRLKTLPAVVLVTAHGRELASKVLDELDMTEYLTKPVTPSDLMDSIMNVMGGQTTGKPSPAKRQQVRTDYIEQLQGARVLVVEDNEINQELVMELLTTNGIKVAIANNGSEALEVLNRVTFDGVLMDCQMPVMDGYTASREIRRQLRFKDLPILALTANVMKGDREKALQAGMNDQIGKPFKVDEIFRIMSQWIKPNHEHPQ